MNKISVIIITKNEEKNIKACLESVSWADEITIVDAESEDRTVELTKQFNGRVFIKKWEGFVLQKRFALNQANNEWVLSLDADERISAELKNEILKKDPGEFNGFLIRRKNFLFGKEITTCGWDKDYQLRLFRKSKANLNEKLVHEGFVVDGKTNSLENVIIHNTFSSLDNYMKKVNEYTTLSAEETYQTKSKVTALTILTHTFSAFFRYFISLKGFKDGMHGLIVSFINSLSTMLTYTKIWELQRKENS